MAGTNKSGRPARWEELQCIKVLKLCEDIILEALESPDCPIEIKRNIAVELYKRGMPKDITIKSEEVKTVNINISEYGWTEEDVERYAEGLLQRRLAKAQTAIN